MNSYKNTCGLYFVILALFTISCTGLAQEKEKHTHHNRGAANENMHRTPVPELIERFESEERDDYQKPEQVIEYLGNVASKTIMDIGAGSGYFSVRLAKSGAKVIAADVNDEFQAYLRERIKQEELKQLTLRKIPYDSPGLSPEEVDMVLIVNTYHHIEDRENYFAKVKTGTKADGELVIIDFFDIEMPVGPKHHKIPIDTLVDELKKAGYTSFEINVDLLPYQYIVRAR